MTKSSLLTVGLSRSIRARFDSDVILNAIKTPQGSLAQDSYLTASAFASRHSLRVVHAGVSAPAGPNRDDFDPTAEVEGKRHQTVLSMAATMRWVRLRANGIAT
jgi:hypothetical protein